MNTPNPSNLSEDALHYNWLWGFRKQFDDLFDVFGAPSVRFQVQYTHLRLLWTVVLHHPFNQVDHEQREIGGIRHRGRRGVHEILQPPVLLGIAKVELQLETKTVIIDQGGKRQRQIAAKKNDMRLRLGFQIGLDDQHDVQRLDKALVAGLKLIDACFEPGTDPGLAYKPLRNGARIEFVAIDAMWPVPGVRTIIRQEQGAIGTQFGNQLQLATQRHLQGSVGAKMAFQDQIGQPKERADACEQRQEQGVDACELGIEFSVGLGFGGAAFWAATLALEGRGCFGLGAGLGRCRGAFFSGADHLLKRDRQRAALFGTDQRQAEEGQAGYGFASQRGKEPVQSVGELAGFGDDGFITSEDVEIVRVEQMCAKEEPEQGGPGQDGGEKALDGTIAAALAGPTGDAEHGDTLSHSQQGQRDTAELANGRHRDLGMQAQQEW